MINWFIIKPQLGIGIVHFFSISISERYTVFFMASSERNESFDLVYFLIFSFKFSISKQLPHIHRKKIFRTDATITYNKCRLRIKKFAEFIQSFCPFLRIVFHLNGDHRTFLAQNEIDFIIPFTPIKYFKTIHEGLAYQISSDTRFKDSSPCLAVENGLFKGQRAIHYLQRIVIYLQLRNTSTPPCHIHAKFLKPAKQSAFVQQIDIACQCYCVPCILKRA